MRLRTILLFIWADNYYLGVTINVKSDKWVSLNSFRIHQEPTGYVRGNNRHSLSRICLQLKNIYGNRILYCLTEKGPIKNEYNDIIILIKTFN